MTAAALAERYIASAADAGDAPADVLAAALLAACQDHVGGFNRSANQQQRPLKPPAPALP